MTVNRSALKAVVISHQPYLRNYTYLGIKYDPFEEDDTDMEQDEQEEKETDMDQQID